MKFPASYSTKLIDTQTRWGALQAVQLNSWRPSIDDLS